MDIQTVIRILWLLLACDVAYISWLLYTRWHQRPKPIIPVATPDPYISPLATDWFNRALATAMVEEHRRLQIVLDPEQPTIRAIPFAATRGFEFDLWTFHPEPNGEDLVPGLPMSERQSIVNLLLKRFDGFRPAAVAALLRDGSNEDRHLQKGFTPPGWFIPATFFYRGKNVLKAVNIGIEYT